MLKMDLLESSNVENIFAQLGTVINNEYVPSDKCYSILWHIYEKLNTGDTNSRNFRQIIGYLQLVKKDLIPMLIVVNNGKMLDILIKILANIMTPIECLVPPIGQCVGENTECSGTTVLKLNWLLSTSKIAFANLKAIRRITHIIKDNIIKLTSCQGCSSITICDCLRLIKNILHVPNEQYQNYILWMLFSENFDEILNDLIVSSNRKQWTILIIELIALIFKNQHVDQMSSLLTKMNETIISDSSEDNESNTSPYPNNGTSSSPENSSESSNSDDNESDQQLKMFDFQHKDERQLDIQLTEEQDKCSLDNLEENINVKLVDVELKTQSVFKEPTSIIVMSNLKRRDSKDPNELKRSRLERRRSSIEQLKQKIEKLTHKTTTLNPTVFSRKSKLRVKKKTKTKLNLQVIPMHMPSHACISHFLQKFTVRFIRNGFNTLVDEVYNLLTSSNSHQHIDTSLYFWILTYFCRFCKLNGIELKAVRRIVSFKLIVYIVHDGIKISKQLMIAKKQKSHNIHLQTRHLHLAVMSIKEIIKLIDFYIQSAAVKSPLQVELIQDLKYNSSPESTGWIKELISIFALLIRQYDSNIQGIEYLYDLIVTNHMMLSLLDNFKDCLNINDGITANIKKFAAPDLMFNYGIALQNYKKNDELVNEAVFTMMHHIIGEVENTTVLFQPIILKIFLNVFEENDSLYDRWSDLIEYVINKFLNLSQTEFTLKNMPKESGYTSKC